MPLRGWVARALTLSLVNHCWTQAPAQLEVRSFHRLPPLGQEHRECVRFHQPRRNLPPLLNGVDRDRFPAHPGPQ